jgi:hypothetical protein
MPVMISMRAFEFRWMHNSEGYLNYAGCLVLVQWYAPIKIIGIKIIVPIKKRKIIKIDGSYF